MLFRSANSRNRVFVAEGEGIRTQAFDPSKLDTRIGVNDVFGESGPAKELLHKYELDAEGIANRILREMK